SARASARHAAVAAMYRRWSVGSSSTERRKRWRAALFASRARARRPASSSVAGAAGARAGGGAIEVLRADLDQRVSRPLAQPLGEGRVVLCACGFRQARVRDVADEHVLEAVGGLVLERGARLADDQVAEQQVLDRVVDALAPCQVLDRAGPEGTADDRRPLEDGLRDAVEA